MRLRVCALACALTVLGSLAASGPVSAAPRHNHHLTIAAVPNPILAGEGVLVYGRLFGPDNSRQVIRLYHRLGGSGQGFTEIGVTQTNQFGEYEFNRADGVVMTNRDWFVRGPDGSHSRTVHERVAALITVNASMTNGDTSHPVVFTGHVTPDHLFQRVFLQKQNATGDDWSTIGSGLVGPGSNYLIVHRFRIPGAYSLRVLLRGDARNIRSTSDVDVVIQQTQVPGFTINSSSPVVDAGGSTTISGVLDQPGTTTAEPGVVVQLWGRHADEPFAAIADTVTGQDGSYSFSQTGLTANTVYYVSTMKIAHSRVRRTARLFEGVRDLVTMQASAPAGYIGQTVTFTGTVTPNKADHVIYLQKRGADGDFHTVKLAIVNPDSTYQFTYTLGTEGTQTFRARIRGDEQNLSGASPSVTVTATVPPLSSLPSGS